MATADAAKALAESLINGDITQATVTSEVVILRHPTPYLPLKRGPVTAVASVTIGESDAVAAGDTDGFTVDRFGLTRTYPYGWPVGKITVTYTVGWTAGNEPTAISEAISLLTTWLGTKPEANLSRIEIGDESATINGGTKAAQAPPDAARRLLAPWARPYA